MVKCPKCGAEDVHPVYVHDWGEYFDRRDLLLDTFTIKAKRKNE